MAIDADMIRRVLHAPSSASGQVYRTAPSGAEDARRVLEIACLAVASDGHLAKEELAVIGVIGKELRAYEPTELDALVHRCLALRSRDAAVARLREVADSLSNDAARHLAYKVAVLTAMADLSSTDAEFEFDLDLQDALRLATDVADRLAGEVQEAVTLEEE